MQLSETISRLEEGLRSRAAAELRMARRSGIQKVTFMYSGSGDSGGIDDCEVDPVPGRPIDTREAFSSLEELADALLEIVAPGWEIDSGGYGHIEFHVNSGDVSLLHTTYHTTEEMEEYVGNWRRFLNAEDNAADESDDDEDGEDDEEPENDDSEEPDDDEDDADAAARQLSPVPSFNAVPVCTCASLVGGHAEGCPFKQAVVKAAPKAATKRKLVAKRKPRR